MRVAREQYDAVVRREGQLIMVDDARLPLEPGETPEVRTVRFRTLGCYPLTGAVESNAATLPEIIGETLAARTSERSARVRPWTRMRARPTMHSAIILWAAQTHTQLGLSLRRRVPIVAFDRAQSWRLRCLNQRAACV